MRAIYLFLAALFLLTGGLRAAELTPAARMGDLDLPRCQAYAGARLLNAAPEGTVEALLGLSAVDEKAEEWGTGRVSEQLRYFRLTFTHPIPLGTICTANAGPTWPTPFSPPEGAYVGYLRPDAPAPGDVTKDDQWIDLPPGEVKTLPPGTLVRAVRFTWRMPDALTMRETKMAPVVLLRNRYYDALNIGSGTVRKGAGKLPESWLGCWQPPQPIAGVALPGLRATVIQVETLRDTTSEAAMIARDEAWQRQSAIRKPVNGVAVLGFIRPVTTRGVRITVLQGSANGNFASVLPLASLGDTAEAPTLLPPPPPYTFPYTMPMNGFATLRITDAAGKPVRRLQAETPRAAGNVLANWDLKDDAGAPVPPGTYRWQGLARPPFTLTYEQTVYNAGQPAWPAPPPGKGGGRWLGDHTPPSSACAMGDMLWFGCPVAEDGSSLIATDLDGNKLWGEGAVSNGFHGPDRITTDGQYAYLLNQSLVQRIDPRNNFQTATIYKFSYTREQPNRPNGWTAVNGGAAVKDGKLYVSYAVPPLPWLQTSFLPDVLNPTESTPNAILRKGNGKRGGANDKTYGEGEFDELMRFYGAFLTETMPEKTPSLAGSRLPSSGQAYFGDAPPNGPLAGTLTACFTEPVTVGSLLISDGAAAVYALKPGKKLPKHEDSTAREVDLGTEPEVEDAEQEPFNPEMWTPIPVQAGVSGQPALALAPPKGLKTTALRFKAKRLAFILTLARRFEDVAPRAERVLGEGIRTPKGGWQSKRDLQNPITPYTPAAMALVWPEPVALRGVSLIHPTEGLLSIDTWAGPAGVDPRTALDDDQYWVNQGELRHLYINWIGDPGASTIRTVDFAGQVTTTAVRVRCLRPAGCLNPYTNEFITVPGPHSVAIDGFVAYRYLGGDPESLPAPTGERILELQLPKENEKSAKLLRVIPFPQPGNLAVDPHGVLHVVSGDQVATVPLAAGDTSKIVVAKGALERPAELTFDAEGLLYIVDDGPKVIKVFDPATGKLVRTLGTPGGIRTGPWDPTCFDAPRGLCIDARGNLWLTDATMAPKRVVRMSRTGAIEKNLLGPTVYGGGGVMDQRERAVIRYSGMQFRMNWTTKAWALESILFRSSLLGPQVPTTPDRAVYLHDKRYLVGDGAKIQVICLERNGVAVPVAAAGNLGYWGAIDRYPDLKKAFGKRDRLAWGFVWSDLNGDGIPQVDEVQVTPRKNFINEGWERRVGEDLSFNFSGARLRPTGVRPDGTPTYDMGKLEELPLLDNVNWTTADGRTFVLGDRLLASDGQTTLWSYPDHYLGGFGFHGSGFGLDRPAGVLVGEHKAVGHFTLGNEEYFVTNSDQGDWFCFTGDGLLVGCIFGGPSGFGRRYMSMPDWTPGQVDMSDLRLDSEHYAGSICAAEDGKVYAIAGHNHISIIRVEGLERMRRLPGGALTVTRADQQRVAAWEVEKATQEQMRREPKVARLLRLDHGIEVNGSLDEWAPGSFFPVQDHIERSPFAPLTYHLDSEAALACDEKNLYVAMRTKHGMQNSAQDMKLLFKGGDAVDVTLGLDPKADPKRRGPAAGDVRILIARVNGKPVVVIYRPVAPGAPADAHAVFTSPVGEERCDAITVLEHPQVAFGEESIDKEHGTIIEAAIPWRALGVTDAPAIGERLRGDVGLLGADQNGTSTVARYYWAGKTQTIVADIPSEARLSPALWGEFTVSEPDNARINGGGGVLDVGPE